VILIGINNQRNRNHQQHKCPFLYWKSRSSIMKDKLKILRFFIVSFCPCLILANQKSIHHSHLSFPPTKLSTSSFRYKKYGHNLCHNSSKLLHTQWLSIRGGSDTSRPIWTFGSKPTHPQQYQQSQRQYQQQSSPYPIVEDVTNEENQKQSQVAKEMVDSFLSRDNRQSFITRVYAILTTQLLVTAGVVLYMASHRNIAHWMAFEGRMIGKLKKKCQIISIKYYFTILFSRNKYASKHTSSYPIPHTFTR